MPLSFENKCVALFLENFSNDSYIISITQTFSLNTLSNSKRNSMKLSYVFDSCNMQLQVWAIGLLSIQCITVNSTEILSIVNKLDPVQNLKKSFSFSGSRSLMYLLRCLDTSDCSGSISSGK